MPPARAGAAGMTYLTIECAVKAYVSRTKTRAARQHALDHARQGGRHVRYPELVPQHVPADARDRFNTATRRSRCALAALVICRPARATMNPPTWPAFRRPISLAR